jgi:hypothetical protein
LSYWLQQLQTQSITSACASQQMKFNFDIICNPMTSTSTNVCIWLILFPSVNYCVFYSYKFRAFSKWITLISKYICLYCSVTQINIISWKTS